MNRLFCILALLLLISFQFSILGACVPQNHQPLESIENSTKEGIVYYDIFFEIDPSQEILRSHQRISLTGNLAESRKLSIFIGDDLIIDRLTLEDDTGNELTIMKWQKVDSYSIDYWWGQSVLSEIEIQTTEMIPSDGHLIVDLDYHLPDEAFQEGVAKNMYNLFVSSQGSHAGGPESGAFPMVTGDLSAPFSLTIKHPNNFQCAAPGERVVLEESDGYVMVTYQTDIPYDPSFTCAPYHIMSKAIDGMSVELFTPSHLDVSPEMLTTASQILMLYQEKFGKPSARSFRIVFLNLADEASGGESNGNIIFLGDIKPFLSYEESEEAKDMFAHLVAHEGYHLWNCWSLNWEGTLSKWWVEGGANFMASWVKELLYGDESGANNRLRYLKGYDEQEAYRYKKSLANLDDKWGEDWALVYDYGAVVWEQLRQKVGSDAMMASLRDFYETHSNQTTNYNDFVTCMEKHTEVDVHETLEQWTQHNARIDLIIHDVTILCIDGHYEILVDYEIDADRDYELFTALGYKTLPEEDWQLIDVHLSKAGQYSIKFESDSTPLEIKIDPEYRVPQINLDDNSWVDNNAGLHQSHTSLDFLSSSFSVKEQVD